MGFVQNLLTILLLGLLPFGATAQTVESPAAPSLGSTEIGAPDYSAWNTRAEAIEAELEQPGSDGGTA